MNQRIKQLMAQAGTDTSGKWMGVEHVERFAELIVQDLLDVALYGDELEQARDNVKQYLESKS